MYFTISISTKLYTRENLSRKEIENYISDNNHIYGYNQHDFTFKY